MMSPAAANFNSLTESVTVIHALRLRASRGENVNSELSNVLSSIHEAECAGPDDAVSLLQLSRMVLDHILHRNEGNGDNPDAVLAAHSWMYLSRAITHLEELLRQADLQNGATIN
jgi:hypothetical protein